MDNKQKIIEILDRLYDGQTVWDVRPIADEIDALYTEGCGECKRWDYDHIKNKAIQKGWIKPEGET